MRVCVITDNAYIYEEVSKLIGMSEHEFSFFYSFNNASFTEKYRGDRGFRAIKLKGCDEEFFSKFDVFISLHCKQLFPSAMVQKHRCINVHPGINPYNRGWYPQVFSILNGAPVGVTIHEMDEELDHGPIIYQKEVEVRETDTSFDVYKRILSTEIELLRDHLDHLILGEYTSEKMLTEGNINYKADFDRLCVLDMESVGTLKEHIDLLRATTFPGYNNAYYLDKDGNKVYISININVGVGE